LKEGNDRRLRVRANINGNDLPGAKQVMLVTGTMVALALVAVATAAVPLYQPLRSPRSRGSPLPAD